MNILNEYFDKIYCINLDDRSDRWEVCEDMFNRYNLKVERFSGINGKQLDFGFDTVKNCELAGTLSHSKVIKKAIDSKFSNVLILEDDIEFKEGFFENFEILYKSVPPNYDILFFGGNHTGGYKKVHDNCVRCYKTFALQSYVINRKCMNMVYDNMCNMIGQILTTNKSHTECVSFAADFLMGKLHNHLEVYSFYPNYTYQRESFSDIQQDNVFYDFLKNK